MSRRTLHPNIRERKTRGFHEVTRGGLASLWIRDGFVLAKCDGDAHGPNGAFIDNCMRCAPLWGDVVIPETRALTDEEVAALVTFADANGSHWKTHLGSAWARASAPSILHALRNSHGTTWLHYFDLDAECLKRGDAVLAVLNRESAEDKPSTRPGPRLLAERFPIHGKRGA